MVTRPALFLCGVVLLAAPAGAPGQDVKMTRNPVRNWEDLLSVWKGAEDALAEAQKGRQHWDRGEFEPARACFEKSLALMRKNFPDDSVLVGMCHAMLGGYYWAIGDPVSALPHARKHLATVDNVPLGIKFPQHELNRALATNNLGGILESLGDLAEAEKCYREALALRRKMNPAPEGDLDIVTSLGNLASVLSARGEHAAAEKMAEEAHAMVLKLFDGKQRQLLDPSALARAVNNLAETRRQRGENREAEALQKAAVEIRESAFPAGHPDLAMNIRNLAITRIDRGEWEAGAEGLEKAVAMLRKFFPADRPPRGHPDLCKVLRDLGGTRAAMGDYPAADRHLREALRMADGLFPRSKFPDGHPELATCLTHLGVYALRTPATRETAARSFREAFAITSRYTNTLSESLSEAEVLNLVRSLPGNLSGLLSATAGGPFDPRDYRYVWASKAAVMRVAERRRRALLARDDPEAQRLAAELEGVRAELSIKLFAPARPDTDRLAARKEELQRALAARLRLAAPADDTAHPFDLADALPPGAAFVDLIGYVRMEQDPRVPGADGFKAIPHYAAFVLSRGGRPERVELGPMIPIDDAVETWRRAIAHPGSNERAAAREVGRLFWKSIADRLPAGTTALYVAPDASLSRIPFAALPGRGADSVLLEDMAVAVVPHGPFLLDRLKTPPPARAGKGRMLVVGGVDYGPLPPDMPMLPRGERAIRWTPLPDGEREAKLIAELGRTTGKVEAVELTAGRADAGSIRAELPRVRFAHLSTHGFFADGTFLSALGADPEAFRLGPRDLHTAATRNPLALSGLAFAGANRAGADAPTDRGLLTAEAIAGLRLAEMDLAVLSACETGLGTELVGEGVFGLQRAFHLAGCRTVVASLWKVDDAATRELMEAFYRNLLAGGADATPAKALRAAQLEMLRKSRERGLVRAPVVVPPEFPPPRLPAPAPGARFDADTYFWAAFVVSGGP